MRPSIRILLLALAILAPVIASTAAPSYAETRVWGFELEEPARARAQPTLSQTCIEGYPPAYDGIVVGCSPVPRERARFEVTESGVAIPTKSSELRDNLSKLDDVSTSPASSRKFTGTDSQGPIRVRVEKAHPADPNFTGPPDPLHTVDHLHLDRRRNIDSGPWKSTEKVPYDWPYDK